MGSSSAKITEGMVAAAHPEAAKAGASVLANGGNAMDAAVATAFALGVVEPHASGLGGGGFFLYYDAASGKTTVYDYREMAPAGLKEEHFVVDGKPVAQKFRKGGLAAGVPGTTAGLLKAHGTYGALPRAAVLEPAIDLAENGFAVTKTLAGIMQDRTDLLLENDAAAETYLEDGLFAREIGSILEQPTLADTYRKIAEEGESAFYSKEAARPLVEAVEETGGVMTVEDMTSYAPRVREPIRGAYRGYDILTIGPPSSGGIQVVQALKLLDKIDMRAHGSLTPEYVAILAQIFKLVEEAADEHVADPAFHDVPVDYLLSDAWVDENFAKLRLPEGGSSDSSPMIPEAVGAAAEPDGPGNTTHLSVVDSAGNIAALTQTINYFFGAAVVVPETGVLLNNEMYDFTFEKGAVNYPEGGKIPRSSISPIIVLKDGRPIATLGTPGGRRIASAIIQIIVQKIDFGATLQDAINAPRLYTESKRGRLHYEDRVPEDSISEAGEFLNQADDWDLNEREAFDKYFGGAQGIWLEGTAEGNLSPSGAADPRRDGIAVSENDPSL